MATDLLKLFGSLGLSNTEAKVYIASLKLGPTSVQEIAKTSRLSRTATYDAVAMLQDRGLMSTFERGKKRFFAAEDPESAVAHFRQKIEEMNSQVGVLERSVGEIKLMSGGEKPAVRFFEGNDALYALFHDVAAVQPKEVCELSNMNDIYAYLDEEVLRDARKATNVKHADGRILHYGEHKNPREGRQYRELKAPYGNFHGDIWIYADRIALITFVGKTIVVMIQNDILAQTVRALFEIAWDAADPERK